MIDQACRYIDPATIFTIEMKILFPPISTSRLKQVEETLDKIKKAEKTLKDFKSCFQVQKFFLANFSC